MTPAQIKALRLDFDMTHAQFGRVIGVEWRSVYRWEDGSRIPGEPALRLLEMLKRGEMPVRYLEMRDE